MSPDVIKAAEFEELYEGIPASGDGSGVRGFSSHAKRIRELESELESERARTESVRAEARAEGSREAEERVKSELASEIAAVRAAAADLRRRSERQLEIATDEIGRVAVAVAAKIVRREISGDDDFVVRLIRRCLRKIVHRQEIEIRVHPDDHEGVVAALEELASESGPGHDLTVRRDRRVERGGCVLETPDFVVDGMPRSQIERAAEALAGERG